MFVGPLEIPFLSLLERVTWKVSTNDGFRFTPSWGSFSRQIKEMVQECIETYDRPRFIMMFTTKKLILNPREQAQVMPSLLMRDDTHKVWSISSSLHVTCVQLHLCTTYISLQLS